MVAGVLPLFLSECCGMMLCRLAYWSLQRSWSWAVETVFEGSAHARFVQVVARAGVDGRASAVGFATF